MLGHRIKSIRKGKSLTLKAFATELGTSPGFISEIENGLKMPGYELLISLKRIYGVDLNWLLTGEDGREGAGMVTGTQVQYQAPAPDPVTEKINQHLEQMCEEQRRDVLKYAEEKKQLAEFLKERGMKKAG